MCVQGKQETSKYDHDITAHTYPWSMEDEAKNNNTGIHILTRRLQKKEHTTQSNHLSLPLSLSLSLSLLSELCILT